MEGRKPKLTANSKSSQESSVKRLLSDFTKIKRPARKHKSPQHFEITQNKLVAKDELVRTTSSSHRGRGFAERGATNSSDHEVEAAAISEKLHLLEIEIQDIVKKFGDFHDRLRSRTRLDELTETSEDKSNVDDADNIMTDAFGRKELSEREPSRSESFKKKEKLHFLIDKLIMTEEYYIEGLAKVIKNYMGYISNQSPPKFIGSTHYLFGNIRHIYENTKDFHRVLKTRGYDAEGIAQTFVDFAPQFELYPLYSKNKPTANMYLQQFDSVIKERQKQLGDKLGLASYLFTPIQRLENYVHLLESLQKELKKNEQPTESISAAINVVRKVMRKSNDYIEIDSIKNSPVDLSDTGSFRMRSLFTIHKPRKFESMVFLFDHIVVFTENTQGVSGVENYSQRNLEHFNYVDSIAMSDLSLGELQENSCIFQLTNHTKAKSNHKDAIFVLEAKVAKIKEEWTYTIGRILWSQFELVKEQQRNQSCVRKLIVNLGSERD